MENDEIDRLLSVFEAPYNPKTVSKDVQRATQAAEKLSATKDPTIAPRLIPHLEGGFRNIAAYALLEIQGVDALPAVLNARAHPPDWDDQDGWMEMLSGYLPEFGAAALPVLRDMQPNADRTLRAEIALALGMAEDAAALPLLLDLSHDPESSVREAAVAALGYYDDQPEAIERLQAMYTDDPADVVASAAYEVLHPIPYTPINKRRDFIRNAAGWVIALLLIIAMILIEVLVK